MKLKLINSIILWKPIDFSFFYGKIYICDIRDAWNIKDFLVFDAFEGDFLGSSVWKKDFASKKEYG